ncbi:MAG: CapA family protein [Clostridia bacterium]|nr:CapA family protein [Clostridia bacterium]
MSIIIGADIVPVDSNAELFANGRIEELIGPELQAIMDQADYRIFNLEVPLTNHVKPIAKHGPNLFAPTAAIAGIKAMKIDLLTLANNHIMDHDTQGLESTIDVLDKAKIAHVGADRNLQEAQKPYFFTVDGKRYGVYACAEHEFSIANENKPGANPFDPLESLDHIIQMKAQCDYAIVLYHGGKECYRYPSPYLQKSCRKMVEKGADLVVCQHSHCIGCEEKYLNGTIIYGQGNFLFDYKDNEYWNTSLLVQIEANGLINYIPLAKKSCGVTLAKNKDAEEIMNAFRMRSKEIQKDGFIEEKFSAYAKENMDSYIMYFSGKRTRFLFRAMNKLSGYRFQRVAAKHYIQKNRFALRNYIECEDHRETVLKGLDLE